MTRTIPALSVARVLRGAVLALGLAILASPGYSAAPERKAELSKEDKACLDCHAKPGQRMQLASGESMSIYIAPDAFANSKHIKDGCEGCHSEIDAKSHGKDKDAKPVAAKRSHSTGMQETCRDCHKKTMQKYDDSVHAKLLHGGSEKAPLCADCHDPHATRSLKDASASGGAVVCEQCHKALTAAFNKSVHGPGDEGLECKDCHRTHDVKAASAGDHLRGQCVSCHKDIATTHASWLPNTGRHLEAVACAACHSPTAARRVDLRIYETQGTKQAAEKVGVPSFVKTTGTAGDTGLDGRALWSLLQEFNREGFATFVRGRLEVQTGAQSHALASKAKAIKDCATCHRQGAAAFQQVTVSLIGPDGLPLRRGASQGILNSAESIGAVSGFYAIGGTRIKLLDVLLLMALAAGILGPAAHLAVKLTVARRRQAEAAQPKE